MTNRIRILHVLKSNSFSGAENVVITICRNIRKDYECAYASVDGPIAGRLAEENVVFYPMRTFSIFELRRIIKEYRPDIVHAHDFSASVYCACYKKKYHLVSHLHNNPPWILKWNMRSILYRMFLKRMEKIIIVSTAIAQEAVFLRCNKAKIMMIENPVDDVYIEQKALENRVEKIDILFLGRITEQKNPQKFIRIVNYVRKQGIDVKTIMVGDGNLDDECRKMIRKMDLQDNIQMIGFCKNPYPYIKKAKVMLITSEWEGYGLVAVEALLLGTPVLASEVGGLKMIFKGMPFALCRSEREFCEKTIELLQNEEIYKNYKNEIKSRKEQFRNLKRYMDAIEGIYKELVK